MKIIGIDLGTTNSCVAAFLNGEAVVLTGREGGRLTPSVLTVTETGERLVGELAKRQAVTNASVTVAGVKRLLGRSYDSPEVAELRERLPFETRRAENGDVRIVLHDQELSPEEVSAAVLMRMRAIAEQHLDEAVTHAVITVPAYFDDRQRRATLDAARIAGLEVPRILNEPTAAALAYGTNRDESEIVAVYDFGGGTFDISILEMQDGVFNVRATRGENFLGGDDLDERLVEWMVTAFEADTGIRLDLDATVRQRLCEAAERAKVELSTSVETTIHLPFIASDDTGPQHLEYLLSRGELENLVRDLVERTVGPCQRCLEDAGLEASNLDSVVLVGGQTRMPLVQETVHEIFGRRPARGVHPEEVVAVGAALHAGVLEGSVDDTVLLDVIPLSLGIEVEGGIMSRVIDRNTTVPTRSQRVFSTAADDQDMVSIRVLQGERQMAEKNRHLGLFELYGIPLAPRGVPQIEVAFEVNANGMLSISATDRSSGVERAIRVSAGGGLSNDEIDRLVLEAEQHRQADSATFERDRVLNALSSFAHQCRRTLNERRHEMDEQQQSEFSSAIRQLEQLLGDREVKLEELLQRRDALVETVRRVVG